MPLGTRVRHRLFSESLPNARGDQDWARLPRLFLKHAMSKGHHRMSVPLGYVRYGAALEAPRDVIRYTRRRILPPHVSTSTRRHTYLLRQLTRTPRSPLPRPPRLLASLASPPRTGAIKAVNIIKRQNQDNSSSARLEPRWRWYKPHRQSRKNRKLMGSRGRVEPWGTMSQETSSCDDNGHHHHNHQQQH